MKTLKDMDLKGKKILVRVDFNVPLENGLIKDDERIQAALPTINYLLDEDCKIILASHLGQPEKKDPAFSLRPIAERLEELLGKRIPLIDNCRSPEVKMMLDNPRSSRVLLLENLRFYRKEEANDPKFAQNLASLGEIFIQEAFACCHRSHASIIGVPNYLPSCAGFLLEKEIRFLSDLLIRPQKPFVAIIGGAKISDKIGLIENFLPKIDVLLIGGRMAHTFLKATGMPVGSSKTEDNKLATAKKILKKARKNKVEVILSMDHVILNPETDEVKESELILPDWQGVDIGEFTTAIFETRIKGAQTIFWNGPLGRFEDKRFMAGTKNIAWTIARASQLGATAVVGGGETLAALKMVGAADKFTHLSTGGGATLQFLEGKSLPGIEALK